MAVITISRQFGAGGRTLGERVARRLGYRYVNEDMIRQVAAKAKVTPGGVHAFEQEAGSMLTRLLDKVVSGNFIERILAGEQGYLSQQRYVNVVREIIMELCEEGDVVIIGRGGQYILKEALDAWHVLLVGDDRCRTDFICRKYGTDRSKAHKVVAAADRQRNSFLRCFGFEDHDNPLHYHLTINTGLVSLEKAEQMIVDLIA